MPLVAHRLREFAGSALPADIDEGLALFLEGEVIAARSRAEQYARLLTHLAVEKIPAIPFKGPLLALDLYGDVALRSSYDLDILVRDADEPRVLTALMALGYHHGAMHDAQELAAVRRYGGQYILFHPDGVPVEPHWLIAPTTLAFDLDYDRLWQRALPSEVLGAPCLRLPPEDKLLVLCLHGAKERWRKLKWIIDIAAYVSVHPDIDWRRLRAEAAEQGCARMLALGLSLACRVSPLPETMYPSRDAEADRLAAEVMERLGRDMSDSPGPYQLSGFTWRMRERARDRWAYALRTITTPRAAHVARLHLPRSLEWAYYPLKLPWDYVLTPCLKLGRRLRQSRTRA